MLDDDECGGVEVSSHGELVDDFGGAMLLLFGGLLLLCGGLVECVNHPAES